MSCDDRLIGRHVLSGVWMTEYSSAQYMKAIGADWTYGSQHSSVCLILLDGQVWRFMEDPDDGYRSSCHAPQLVTDVFPVNWWQASERVHGFHVKFAPSPWVIEERDCGKWWVPGWKVPAKHPDGTWVDAADHCEYLVLVSEITDKPVLVVGTSNTDDYYPSFVASFQPQNMSLNSERRDVIDIVGTADMKEEA